jgi:hypothetical protein
MIINEMQKTVKVTPILKSLESVSRVQIVTAAIAYDDPRTGETYVLVTHQGLHFEEKDHCLICPMQLRLNDIAINKRPKFWTAEPTKNDHAIICE